MLELFILQEWPNISEEWLLHDFTHEPRAKSRDHEIVRAQKKVSKGHPKAPPKSFSVVTNPQV